MPSRIPTKQNAHSSGRKRKREPQGDSSTESAPIVDVGNRLRSLRRERDLTLRALAETSGLAINTLSQIENSKVSPSVSTLQHIAVALEVPIMAFFEVEGPEKRIAYVKGSRRPQAAFAHGILEDLGAGPAQRTVEPFVITLEPHTGSGSQPIVHTGYEFFYCLEGRITYTIEEHTYLLEPGDSLLFESHLPHRWENVDSAPSRALLILYPTDARDRPTEQHFVR